MRSSVVNAPPAEPDNMSAPSRCMFAVQVRYAHSDWVTLATLSHRRTALRAAATAYRDAVSPEGSSPYQVRLVEV
jgi:chorismate synthase